jgi:Spy/CpxP family protein refolding chaperone
MNRFIALALTGFIALPALADTAPYAGQDERTIKALAPERIEGLRMGAGLGYAKTAELNGWPGPLHALELADALALSADQLTEITAIRTAMLAKAKPLGEDLIAAEAALDALFAEEVPDVATVAEATAQAGVIEAKLRAVHLAAHIEVKPLLTRHQQMIYAQHRGYGNGHSGHGRHGEH